MKILVFFFCLMLVFFGVVNGNVVKKCKHKIPFICPEDGSCIKSSKKCDGKKDCPNGFDESFVVCKEYSSYEPFRNQIFVCANGATIDNHNICSRNQLCSDGSDQLPKRCEPDYTPTIRGNCSSDSMECHSGICIKNSKMCDGQVDCLDGRDESLELCYNTTCSYPDFRCANGNCINAEYLCNNQFDCVDGSDEIPHVCNRICAEDSYHTICKSRSVMWESKGPAHCIEPIEKGIEFTNDTTFHRNNTLKYVYANGVVKFKCVKAKEDAIRIPNWNVCLNTGQWRNPLPKCEKVNMDPKTNGSMGCPINYYDNDKMRIFKCASKNSCSQEIQPPINNMTVKIECNDGYHLSGNDIVNHNSVYLHCFEMRWLRDIKPRCTKFCNGSEISGLYALELLDKDHYRYNVLPGEIANFKCPYSFNNDKELTFPQLECLEDGTWKGLEDLKKKQHDYCSYNCMNPTARSYSRSSQPAGANEAPWLTAIYREGDNKPICAGALIRLDLVLTAAHCLYSDQVLINKEDIYVRHLVSDNDPKPSSDHLWIRKYDTHPRYTAKDDVHDIAILTLKERISKPVQQGIGCLPWPSFSVNKSSGNIDTWDSINETLGVVIYDHKGNSTIQKGLFQASVTASICVGDSGSPVVVNCESSRTIWNGKCIIGIVIGSFSSDANCSNSLTIAELNYFETRNFIEQVQNEIFTQE